MIDTTLLKTLIQSSNYYEIGQTHRYNHTDCPAGKDERERLYVTRSDDKFYIAYCHNCSDAGWYRTEWYRTSGSDTDELIKDLEKVIRMPLSEVEVAEDNEDYIQQGKELTFSQLGSQLVRCELLDPWMKMWFNRAGISDKHIDSHLTWRVNTERNTVSCVISYEGKIVGYQERMPPGHKPKTITTYAEAAPRVGFHTHGTSRSLMDLCETLVITEDPLSATCANLSCPTTSAYALLGTHVSDAKLAHIVDIVIRHNIRQIVIWLDPDEAGIKGAEEVYNRLKAYLVTPLKVVNGITEPAKQGSLEAVNEVVKFCITK